MKLEKRQKIGIAILVGLIAVIGVAFAASSFFAQISTGGIISNLTVSSTVIDWGSFKPGDTSTRTITVTAPNQNILLVITADLTPYPYLTLTCNGNNTMLTANTQLLVTFSLSASSDAVLGGFNFDIDITGT